MKMLARLRYLYAEGFEVSSLSGYDDEKSQSNAKILYVQLDAKGRRKVKSELFHVESEEMEQCCNLFFQRLPNRT